jgi:hypothetical protein
VASEKAKRYEGKRLPDPIEALCFDVAYWLNQRPEGAGPWVHWGTTIGDLPPDLKKPNVLLWCEDHTPRLIDLAFPHGTDYSDRFKPHCYIRITQPGRAWLERQLFILAGQAACNGQETAPMSEGKTPSSRAPEKPPEITPEIAKRLSGLPAKDMQHWRAKVYAWLFRNEDSLAAKKKIEKLTGLRFKNSSSIRKMRMEVNDFLKRAPAGLPDKQQKDVAKAMKYLREIYVNSHEVLNNREWDELKEDMTQAMVRAFLDPKFDGNPKSAAQKIIDDFRQYKRKHNMGIDPNTGQPYRDDEGNR